VVIWLTTAAGGVDVVIVTTFPVAELGEMVETTPEVLWGIMDPVTIVKVTT
jgi:hypothetical protein